LHSDDRDPDKYEWIGGGVSLSLLGWRGSRWSSVKDMKDAQQPDINVTFEDGRAAKTKSHGHG
jgi:hypothetical protein